MKKINYSSFFFFIFIRKVNFDNHDLMTEGIINEKIEINDKNLFKQKKSF